MFIFSLLSLLSEFEVISKHIGDKRRDRWSDRIEPTHAFTETDIGKHLNLSPLVQAFSDEALSQNFYRFENLTSSDGNNDVKLVESLHQISR